MSFPVPNEYDMPEVTYDNGDVVTYPHALCGDGTYVYSAPYTVTSASQMTDETKVYLYEGNESGYTAGNWYYYNGSAWASGGAYGAGVQIDSTLTHSGQAADAKATGDEISDLKEDLITSEKTALGYNFVRLANETKTSAGVTFVSDGATIIANGTATNNSIYQAYKFTPAISGEYRLSGCPTGGSNTRYYMCFDRLTAYVNIDIGAGVSVSLTAGVTYTLWAVVCNGYSANDLTFAPSLIFEKALLPESNRGIIDSLLSDMFDATTLTADVTSAGWALVGNGSSVANNYFQMKKYIVSSGDKIYLKLSKDGGGVYQWQNAANVPAGTNTYLIGEPVTNAVDGVVEVPQGATYLIISEKTTNTYNVVKSLVDYGEKEPKTLSQSINPVFLTERFISHRGLVTAPENTIPAIKEAIDSGYKMVEFDVRFTSDNVPVLIHDATINRTARNADGTEISSTIYVANTTYQDLLQYDFGIWKGSEYAGTKIPTLSDALKVLKKNNCCCDCDLAELGDAITVAQMTTIIGMVKNAGMLGYVMFTNTGNGINVALSVSTDIIACVSNVTTTDVIDAAFSILKNAKFPVVSMQYPYSTQEQYNYAHSLGIAIKSFTFSDNNSLNANMEFMPDFQIIDTLKRNEIVLT